MPFLPQNKVVDKITPGSVIEYELHGRPILGVAKQEKGGKWQIVNQEGGALELQPARLFLYPRKLDSDLTNDNICSFLSKFESEAEEITDLFDEEAAWESLGGKKRELSVSDIAQAGFGEVSDITLLATRRALLEQPLYFKRKAKHFLPRTAQAVEEMKKQLEVMAERKKAAEELMDWLENPNGPEPALLDELEQVAAGQPPSKELAQFIQSRDEAFNLLVEKGLWENNQDLNLVRARLHKGFTDDVLEQAENATSASRDEAEVCQLISLTIDGEGSSDLDDALSIETRAENVTLGVHISDASLFVEKGTELDAEALRRGTSIYCPDYKVPMLPVSISSGCASLLAGEQRSALSFYIDLNKEGDFIGYRIEPSSLNVTYRLTYSQADQILYDEEQHPASDTLKMMWQVLTNRSSKRLLAGADSFLRTNVYPEISPDGSIELKAPEETPASQLVTEAMILANESAAKFAAEKGIALLFRCQDSPEVDVDEACKDIPEGPARDFKRRGFLKRSVVSTEPGSHHGLGISHYAQVTSPIRRYVDLLNHRQLLSGLGISGKVLSKEELEDYYKELEPALDLARQIQRDREQFWIWQYLAQKKIKKLSAVAVKLDGPRPLAWLELLGFCYPFKNKRSSEINLGDSLELEITRLNPLELRIF